ncbi:MAG: DUF4831 family protein [Bacteroidaceae bacterium]|nr:DUF4831 family protein [Bacteroidaceae bacterium]
MKHGILTTLILGMALLATAQDVVQLRPEKFNDYALNYYLPKTVTEIEFVASKTTRKAGEYYQYARKYLGISDVITEDSETWHLESATITSRGEANTDERYQLTFKAGQTPYIFVSEEYTILSVNTAPDTNITTTATAANQDVINDIDSSKALSSDILMSGSIAKMAEMAAKQIYRIRESRMDILTGDADNMPADGESLRIVIEQLEQQEQALTALFEGTTSVEYVTKKMVYTPTDNVENQVILRFSEHLGFVDASDLCGAPIYLSVDVTERGEYPLDNKGVVKKVPKGALAYNIPGKIDISLHFDSKTLAREELGVAQLGVVFGLDPALLSRKKERTYVVFDPTTGGITQIGTATE